jgi:hypothetical protein
LRIGGARRHPAAGDHEFNEAAAKIFSMGGRKRKGEAAGGDAKQWTQIHRHFSRDCDLLQV